MIKICALFQNRYCIFLRIGVSIAPIDDCALCRHMIKTKVIALTAEAAGVKAGHRDRFHGCLELSG